MQHSSTVLLGTAQKTYLGNIELCEVLLKHVLFDQKVQQVPAAHKL